MKIKAIVYLVTFLLVGQSSAYALSEVPHFNSAATQRLSRDLVPFNSQEFFNKGQDLIEIEIKRLRERQDSSTEPVLKVNPQLQIDEDFKPNNDRPNIQPQEQQKAISTKK